MARRRRSAGVVGAVTSNRARAAAVAVTILVLGCGPPRLMPTPTIYTGALAKSLFTGPAPSTPAIDLLCITDRASVRKKDGTLAYTSDRSRSMAFGSAMIEIGDHVSWRRTSTPTSRRRRSSASSPIPN